MTRPKLISDNAWIDVNLLPPGLLIATPMELSMVSATERNREVIADLAAECAGLGESEMVGIGWHSAANKAGLCCHETEVIPISPAPGFSDCKLGFLARDD